MINQRILLGNSYHYSGNVGVIFICPNLSVWVCVYVCVAKRMVLLLKMAVGTN